MAPSELQSVLHRPERFALHGFLGAARLRPQRGRVETAWLRPLQPNQGFVFPEPGIALGEQRNRRTAIGLKQAGPKGFPDRLPVEAQFDKTLREPKPFGARGRMRALAMASRAIPPDRQ